MSENKVTVEELDQLVSQMKAQREIIDVKKKELTELNAALEELEDTAVNYLKDLGRENYSTDMGTMYIAQRWRVTIPKTDEEKAVLFEHLRQRGIFERYATVNSNSLNSLWNEDFKAAQEDGVAMEFKMPGVGEPKLYEQLNFRKK